MGKRVEKKPIANIVQRKKIVAKPINKVVPKKRTKPEPKPEPEPEVLKEKKVKGEDKYIRIACDAKIEEFKEMSDRVHAGEVKWSYYAFDTTKGYHHYIVLPKK